MPRRYTIEIRDVETGETVLFTAADWTDEQKRAAVQQTMTLAGIVGIEAPPARPPRPIQTANDDEGQ